MENQNTVNEPAAPYGQPLDFQQLWLITKETEQRIKDHHQQERFYTEGFLISCRKGVTRNHLYHAYKWG